MKFGIFYELSVPRPFGGGIENIEKQVYDNALEQVRVARPRFATRPDVTAFEGTERLD